MLILPGNSSLLSFTDDTSPRLLKRRFKVSIHAQVWRDTDLDWYFEMLSYFKGVAAEIKSEQVLQVFPNLPGRSKRKIVNGLSKVPIHIADPSEYHAQLTEILQRVTRSTDDIESMMRTKARDGDVAAKKFVVKMDTILTQDIIYDSPAERLKRLIRSIDVPTFGLDDDDPLKQFRHKEIEPDPSVSAFERSDGSPDIRTATFFSSKSASAFAHISDYINEQVDAVAASLFRFHVWNQLAGAHAFDQGNDVVFRLIEEKRSEVADVIEAPWRFLLPFQKFEQYSSEDSFYGQAADIAAGFARIDFERNGLRGVAESFEYVLFNGERVTTSLLDKLDRRFGIR